MTKYYACHSTRLKKARCQKAGYRIHSDIPISNSVYPCSCGKKKAPIAKLHLMSKDNDMQCRCETFIKHLQRYLNLICSYELETARL